MRRLLFSALLLGTSPASLPAQSAWHAPVAEASSAAPLSPEQRSDVIHALADRLESTYHSPEIGRTYAAALRSRLSSGAYGALDRRDALANVVTAELQAINKDGHLGLRARPPGLAPNGRRREEVKAIARSGWVAEGVAYLEFRIFNGDDSGLAELRRFIADHAGARTLIIDARLHYGGGVDELDVLFPALFARPTALLQGDAREEIVKAIPGGLDSSPEFTRLAAPAGIIRHEHRVVPPAGGGVMSKADVYLLVSRDTVSAGEHMALALKRTGRATLIGQTTRGAGNFGRPFQLPHGFSAFVPFGRSFDPDTGQGWEGIGVSPHVEVAPERALDEALRRAGARISAEEALAKLK